MTFYGDETKKALSNFGPGYTPPGFILAMAEVKKAALCAIQSAQTPYSESEFDSLVAACDHIIGCALCASAGGYEQRKSPSVDHASDDKCNISNDTGFERQQQTDATANNRATSAEIFPAQSHTGNESNHGGTRPVQNRSTLEICAAFITENFPLPLSQGGAGTSLNMNLNEVIAALAAHLLQIKTGTQSKSFDPIADCNRFQSTNDVFPTALTISILRKLESTEKSVVAFQSALCALEAKYPTLLMLGRTQMQSALPITFSQLIGAYAGSAERDRWRISKVCERFRTVALGGTALGTSFGAPRAYIFKAEQTLREITGLNLSRSQNLPDEISNSDKYAEAANALSALTLNIQKFCADMRLFTGSMCGELIHPDLQYGSSIMAAKTNPVILEFAQGLAMRVETQAQLVTRYAASSQMQLNAFLPFIADTLFKAIDDAQRALDALCLRFLPLVKLDTVRIEQNLYSSAVMLNALVPLAGYAAIKTLYQNYRNDPPKTREEFIARVSELTGYPPEQIENCIRPENCTSASK